MNTRGRKAWVVATTLFSIALLGWAIGEAAPSQAVEADTRQAADFLVERLPVEPRDASPRGELHVIAILADGLYQRLADLHAEGNWQANDLWSFKVTDAGAVPPARIRVRARALTLGLWQCPEGARVRIRGGADPVTIDLAGPWKQVWVDVPSLAPAQWITPVALLVLLILAGVVRPWHGGRRATAWLVLHLVVLHFLYWGSQPIGASGDTPGYFDSLGRFAQGHASYYPPGYPLFLGFCQLWTDRVGSLATLLQHGMFVACFLWLYGMMRAALFETAAFVTCLIGASLAPGLAAPQMVISEPLATFCIGGALYVAWTARTRESHLRSILAGLLVGCGGLVRAVPIAATLPGVALLLLFPWRQRRLRLFGLTLAATAAVVLASMTWTWALGGRAAISDGAPAHLYNHFVLYQRLLDEAGPRTMELRRALGDRDPRDTAHWDVSSTLWAHGYSGEESLRLMGDVAFEAAGQATLLQHVQCILGLAWREVHADTFDSAPDKPWMDSRLAAIENPPFLQVNSRSLAFRDALRSLYAALWPGIPWLFLLGLLLSPMLPGRRLLASIGWAAAGYLLATACIEYFLERYNIAVFPFMVCTAAVPLILLAQWSGRVRLHGAAIRIGRLRLRLPALRLQPREPSAPDAP